MDTQRTHTTPAYLAETAIFLLACFLLTFRLDSPNLWVDEFATLQMIQGAFSDVMAACIRDIHPPVYFILLKGWTLVFGESDTAVRMLSVLFAAASVILTGLLAHQLMGPKQARLPMLFIAVHPAFIQFSRMARYYALVVMLGLLSTVVLNHAVSTGRRIYWGVYALAGILLLYTFYPAGILFVAHGLVFILPRRNPKAFRNWLVCMVVTAAFFIPWALQIFTGQYSLAHSMVGSDLARTAMGFVLGFGVSFYTFSLGETLFPWRAQAVFGLVSVVILMGLALFGNRRAIGITAGLPAIICMIFMSFVTTFLSVGTPFINTPVRALFALPYYLLMLSAGWQGLQNPKIKRAVFIMLLVVWGSGLFNYYAGRDFLNPIYFTPAKEAARIVSQKAGPDDIVISDLDSIFAHYFLPAAPEMTHLFTAQTEEIFAIIKDNKPARVWLVTIGRDRTRHISPVPAIRKALAGAYGISQREPLLPMDETYRWVKNKIMRRDTYRYRLTIETFERVR